VADDDPAIEIRLRKGAAVRHFRIAALKNGAAWCILGGSGFQVRITVDRRQAVQARERFDQEIARLLEDGWTPAEA
jgi:hypothetical protein